MKKFTVDSNGFYGDFGGAYIPEILYDNVETLKNSYLEIIDDPSFRKEYEDLLRDYAGRPSPLFLAKRLSEKHGCKIYLKREDAICWIGYTISPDNARQGYIREVIPAVITPINEAK